MKTRHLIALAAVISMAGLTACSGYKDRTLDYLGKRPTTGTFFTEDETPMVELNYDAGDEIASLLKKRLPVGSPITVKIFRLRGNPLITDFARISTEQVASRIAQEGFTVVADDSNYPTKAEDPDLPDPVKCVLAGAYTVGSKKIFLTAAVTTVNDGQIVGSWDWSVPLNHHTRDLLPHDKDNPMTPIVNTSSPYKKDDPGSTQTYQNPSFAPELEKDIN